MTNEQKYSLLVLRFGAYNKGNRWVWIEETPTCWLLLPGSVKALPPRVL